MNFLKLIATISFSYFLYHVFIYTKTKVPIVVTPKEYYKELFNNFKIESGKNIYELGSGRGDFLFAVEKFAGEKLVGYELSFLHVAYARLRAYIKKSNAKFFAVDFFEEDLSDADIIYMFMVEPIINKAWKKIKNECKRGTVVIVLADKIYNETPFLEIATRPNKSKSSFYRLYKV